jgi:hypothetical protein
MRGFSPNQASGGLLGFRHLFDSSRRNPLSPPLALRSEHSGHAPSARNAKNGCHATRLLLPGKSSLHKKRIPRQHLKSASNPVCRSGNRSSTGLLFLARSLRSLEPQRSQRKKSLHLIKTSYPAHSASRMSEANGREIYPLLFPHSSFSMNTLFVRLWAPTANLSFTAGFPAPRSRAGVRCFPLRP